MFLPDNIILKEAIVAKAGVNIALMASTKIPAVSEIKNSDYVRLQNIDTNGNST